MLKQLQKGVPILLGEGEDASGKDPELIFLKFFQEDKIQFHVVSPCVCDGDVYIYFTLIESSKKLFCKRLSLEKPG